MQKRMQKRAERLREYIEDECAKLNDESLGDHGVVLPDDVDEPASIPHRFVTNEWDGSSTWLRFGDTPEEMREMASELGGGDYPQVAGSVLDLDTGNYYAIRYTAALEPYRFVAEYRYRLRWDDGSHSEWLPVRGRFATREAAEEMLTITKEAATPADYNAEYMHALVRENWIEEVDDGAQDEAG